LWGVVGVVGVAALNVVHFAAPQKGSSVIAVRVGILYILSQAESR
jgi:hypothetical protein